MTNTILNFVVSVLTQENITEGEGGAYSRGCLFQILVDKKGHLFKGGCLFKDLQYHDSNYHTMESSLCLFKDYI